MNIYVFGNPLIKEDSWPIKFLTKLKKAFPQINFIVTDPNENFPPKEEKDLIILDTVLGIKKPVVLDLGDFQSGGKTPISPHDYDLLFHLLLLKKTKKVGIIKILGIPLKVTTEEVVNFLKKNISSISLLKSGRHRTCKDQRRG